MTRSHLTKNIDDHLGPGETRFFGSGYRRVAYRLDDAYAGSAGTLELTAGVLYPGDWSKKSTTAALKPHLSTIDALILGAEAVERLSGPGRLRRVDINAGATPFEAGLDSIPVSASRLSADGDAAVFAVRVANMQLRYEVEPARRAGPLYGEPYDRWQQRIEDVELDAGEPRAGAAVRLVPALDEGRDPSISMIDSFVVTLQLGQALLYALDNLSRASSNTLWMRQTTIVDDGRSTISDGPVAASASLEGAALLRRRGAIWRTATIAGELGGIHTRCAVAHQLSLDHDENRT